MIAMFCDFCQLSEEKIGVFVKTNIIINFLHKLVVDWAKTANIFAKCLGENI
jgi:hypothetical protein